MGNTQPLSRLAAPAARAPRPDACRGSQREEAPSFLHSHFDRDCAACPLVEAQQRRCDVSKQESRTVQRGYRRNQRHARAEDRHLVLSDDGSANEGNTRHRQKRAEGRHCLDRTRRKPLQRQPSGDGRQHDLQRAYQHGGSVHIDHRTHELGGERGREHHRCHGRDGGERYRQRHVCARDVGDDVGRRPSRARANQNQADGQRRGQREELALPVAQEGHDGVLQRRARDDRARHACHGHKVGQLEREAHA
mmetsp:Transcript_10411/g.32461  ORF Transcript_10411/g.32461 Transcript_10411/m.32461 type:complete len:250 (+) Transcript_10411:80-829(+)